MVHVLILSETLGQVDDGVWSHILDLVALLVVELSELKLTERKGLLLANSRLQVKEGRAKFVRD